jgi:ferredoxin
MALEVRVERARCIATKACINAAPRTFALDPTQVATVVDQGGDDEDDVVRAAESCPTAAITVFKDGEQLF